jgi:hypothetical protein
MKETLKSYIGKALAVHHLGGEGQAAEVGIVERLSEDLLTLKQRGDLLIHIAIDKIVKFRPLAGVSTGAEGSAAGVDEKVTPPGEEVEAGTEKKPAEQMPAAEQKPSAERWERAFSEASRYIKILEQRLAMGERSRVGWFLKKVRDHLDPLLGENPDYREVQALLEKVKAIEAEQTKNEEG